MPRSYSHRFVATAFAVVICPLLFFVQTQMDLPKSIPALEPKVLTAPFYRFVTIGYWPAAVDWMWIQTLQVVGGRNFSKSLVPFAEHFYEVATDLDPSFYDLYEQAGVFFSFFFQSPDESIHFLEKGMRNANPSWNHSYSLYLLAAYLYSYEKNNWIKAREYYLKAAAIPGSPAYLQSMKQWLQEEGSEAKLAKRVLEILLRETRDEQLKMEYQERLKAL